MLRKGVGLGKTDDALEGLKLHNVANQSLYLLLILVNHCTNGGGGNIPNPYRDALITFGNEAGMFFIVLQLHIRYIIYMFCLM